MKNLVRVLLVAALFCSALSLHAPHKVYAHFLASDGQISAELHIEPNDDPTAGNPQTLFLILSDITKRFHLSNCNCSLSISHQGKTMLNAPLTSPPAGQSTIYSTDGLPFVFPTAGTYRIAVTGRPLNVGNFQPFNLSWNFQISQPARLDSNSSASTFLIYFGGILVAFLIIGIILFALT